MPLAQCRIFEISFVVPKATLVTVINDLQVRSQNYRIGQKPNKYLYLERKPEKADAFLSHCKTNTEDLTGHGTNKHSANVVNESNNYGDCETDFLQ